VGPFDERAAEIHPRMSYVQPYDDDELESGTYAEEPGIQMFIRQRYIVRHPNTGEFFRQRYLEASNI
jgi:hypothetical protein